MCYIPSFLKPSNSFVSERDWHLSYSLKWDPQIDAAFSLFYENAWVISLVCVTENEVFAWGNNAMGQCGQGHTSTPVTKPKKVIGLEGVSIQQITAGTSHSLAWTAVPTDRWEERKLYSLVYDLMAFPQCMFSISLSASLFAYA